MNSEGFKAHFSFEHYACRGKGNALDNLMNGLPMVFVTCSFVDTVAAVHIVCGIIAVLQLWRACC